MDITTRLREVPTMGHDAGCVEEAAQAIEKLRAENELLNLELQKRDKCSFMGAMRDCPTHGESEEIKRLKAFLVTIRDTGLSAEEASQHADDALLPNVKLTSLPLTEGENRNEQ